MAGYKKQTWVDDETVGTADRFNHMEQGIEDAGKTGGIEVGSIIEWDESEEIPEGYEVVTETTYSTEEIETGETWIDGKPIYRKVIETTTPSASNSPNPIYDCNGLNIAIVTNISGVIAGADMCWALNAHASAEYTSVVYYLVSQQDIYAQVGSVLVSQPCKIIIEYTKTTD